MRYINKKQKLKILFIIQGGFINGKLITKTKIC